MNCTVFYLRDCSGTDKELSAEMWPQGCCVVLKHTGMRSGFSDEIGGPMSTAEAWDAAEKEAKKMAKRYDLTAEYTVMPDEAKHTLPQQDIGRRACWLVK